MYTPPSKAERDAKYKRLVTDPIAAMSPEERKFHSDRGAQVARETVAEWFAVREELKHL
jgi:hypothetical protein